jgi:hypothetical protein
MLSFEEQDIVECKRFELACKAIGLVGRAMGLSVTPKNRCVEWRKFLDCGGRIGHDDESAVERMHATMNAAEHHHANTPGLSVRNKIRAKNDWNRGLIPEVVEAIDDCKSGSVRNMSNAIQINKRMKMLSEAEAKVLRLAAVVDVLIATVTLEHRHLLVM